MFRKYCGHGLPGFAFAVATFFSLVTSCYAKEIAVDDVAALNSAMKIVEPGDSLVLKSGEWSDAQVIFRASGTKDSPITLKAAEPGKTVFTGKSTLRIGGEYLVVEGLLFQDPDPTVSDLVQLRIDSDELAHNCRVTNCAVLATRTEGKFLESRWLGLYGSRHRIDHCTIQGKPDKGTTFVVWLGDGSEGKHTIDHNYFGPREVLGANGGETIRIGDSKTSLFAAHCIIEKNLFERCNGEAECISNKSCDNIYRENTFFEVSGALTLRHGNGCLVENNVFQGNDARGTGGIRIIGEDHIVRGNHLEKLAGDDGRSALSLMMGIPNSPANRYFQVKQVLVEKNTILDCKHSILIGLSDAKDATLPPVDTIIRDNIAISQNREIVEARCSLDGISWDDNHFVGKSVGIPASEGIDTQAVEPIKLEPIQRAEVGTNW